MRCTAESVRDGVCVQILTPVLPASHVVEQFLEAHALMAGAVVRHAPHPQEVAAGGQQVRARAALQAQGRFSGMQAQGRVVEGLAALPAARQENRMLPALQAAAPLQLHSCRHCCVAVAVLLRYLVRDEGHLGGRVGVLEGERRCAANHARRLIHCRQASGENAT